MSSWYQKMRAEIAAGGAVEEADATGATREGRIYGVVVLVLLVWLGVRSPWTLVFVVGLLVSVFLHEIGHFATARMTGMKATQFFMGFGPRVISWRRGETEYGLRALPLGAFVRIVGMNNLDEVDPADEPRAYRTRSYPRRLLVITAGSLMHMVVAFVLFFGVFATAGREGPTGRATVLELDPKGPAVLAGIKHGDIIESIGGTPVHTYLQVRDAIRAHSAGEVVMVQVLRGGDVRISRPVTLAETADKDSYGYLGIWADDWGWKKLGAGSAFVHGFTEIGSTVSRSVQGVVTALNPLNSIRHLTGNDDSIDTRPTTVVGVSQVGGTVGESDGLKGILLLLAGVNVFVGVFNMIPLLPFDGGHAAIATYERIRSRKGRPYSADIAKMVPVATVVVGLLGLLFITGLWLDITQPLG